MMRHARWLVGLLLAWALAAEAAEFPAALYEHDNMGNTCTVAADCGVGSEALCIGGVCYYSRVKIEALGDEIEAIEAALCVNMSCVLEATDIDTSAELRAIVTDETGTGALCFASTPTLVTPVIQSYAAGSLPTAGTGNRIAFATSASGTCTTGGGSDVCLCRDTGAAWSTIACTSGDGTFDRCFALDPAEATDDEVEFWIAPYSITLKEAVCHCDGACTGPTATLAFGKRGAGSAFTGIALTGGGSLPCDTSTTASTFVTFDTGDADRIITRGHGLRVSVNNTPTTPDRLTLCVTFQRS